MSYRSITYVYDADDRQVSMKNPSGGIWTTVYDAVGNVVNAIDSLNHTATYVYDAIDRRTATIDSLGSRTTSIYDAVDNRTALIDPVGVPNQILVAFVAEFRLYGFRVGDRPFPELLCILEERCVNRRGDGTAGVTWG